MSLHQPSEPGFTESDPSKNIVSHYANLPPILRPEDLNEYPELNQLWQIEELREKIEKSSEHCFGPNGLFCGKFAGLLLQYEQQRASLKTIGARKISIKIADRTFLEEQKSEKLAQQYNNLRPQIVKWRPPEIKNLSGLENYNLCLSEFLELITPFIKTCCQLYPPTFSVDSFSPDEVEESFVLKLSQLIQNFEDCYYFIPNSYQDGTKQFQLNVDNLDFTELDRKNLALLFEKFNQLLLLAKNKTLLYNKTVNIVTLYLRTCQNYDLILNTKMAELQTLLMDKINRINQQGAISSYLKKLSSGFAKYLNYKQISLNL